MNMTKEYLLAAVFELHRWQETMVSKVILLNTEESALISFTK